MRRLHGKGNYVVAVLLGIAALVLLAMSPHASAAVANPDLAAGCGTKAILVLDESGSIQTTPGAETAVRTAAAAFAAGLSNTGSELAVIEFGSSAKRVLGFTAVTPATLSGTFDPYFSATAASPADVYDSPSQLGQFTNWEDALAEARLLNADSGPAPLVVFITDGDPTAVNTATGVQTGVGSATALAPAVAQADLVKGQGSHILAIGVGAALGTQASVDRLVAISGPGVATSAAGLDLATTDVLRVNDFSTLPDSLRSLVSGLCGSSVTLTKLVDDGSGPVAGGAGWQFTGTVSTEPGVGSDWVAPGPAGSGPRTAVTGADGTATFQWTTVPPARASITLTETARPGYRLASVACQVRSLQAQVAEPLAVTRSGDSFTAPVGPTDIVTCTVVNAATHPAISVTKTVDQPVVAPGTLVTFTITVSNPGDVELTNVTATDSPTPACSRTIGTLAPGASVTYTCQMTVTQSLTNVVVASGSEVTSTSSASSTVTSQASAVVSATPVPARIVETPPTTLRIEKSGPPVARGGQLVTYAVRITNTGSAAAHDVVMRDRLPAGMTLARRTATVRLVKGEVVVPVGILGPGESTVIAVRVRIARSAFGARTNVATAGASNATTVRAVARTRIIRIQGGIFIPRVTG